MKLRSFNLLVGMLLVFFVNSCRTSFNSTNIDGFPENEAIIFASDRSGSEQYYFMTTNGTNVKKIFLGDFPPNSLINRPTWSNSLNKFVFSATVDGDSDIYLTDWDGQKISNLTNTATLFDTAPEISPDSKYIAYISSEHQPDIMVMKADGTDQVNITNHSGRYGLLSWSPDSKVLFFSSDRGGTPNIFSVKPDGNDLTNISQGRGLDGTFSLSPDGQSITFDSDREGAMDIFSININGKSLVNLTNHPARDVEPRWSPNGEKIAFRSDRDGGWDIYIMDKDGSAQVNLTNTPTIDETVISWSPDGQYLLFTSRVNGKSDIFTLGINGEQLINLSNHPDNDYGPIWVEFR